MAKDKETTAAIPAEDRVAKLEAQLAEQQATIDKLIGVVTKSGRAMTPERQKELDWAKMSPEKKTAIEAAKQYPEVPGDARFSCVLLSEKDKPDGFALTIPARSPEEADARYRRIMGITNTTGRIQVARVQAAA